MGNLFGGGTSQNTTTTPDKDVLALYKWMLGQGQNIATQNYPNYTPSTAADSAKNLPGLVAPMTPYQGTALQGIAGLQNYTSPYFQTAGQYAGNAGTPVQLQQFNDAAVNKYMSPYLSNVLGAAVANINETNAQQQQKVLGNAISKGAYGGDRAKIAQSELARQQNLANNATIANILNTGYGQALGEFNTQQTADIGTQIQNRTQAERTANLYANLGTKGQEAQMQQLQAMYGAGGAQQQQRQAELSTAYQQYLNKYAYPYQQLSYFSGLLGGASPNMGATTSAGIPQPSLGTSLIGGVGMLGSMTGNVPSGSDPMAYFGAGANSIGNFFGSGASSGGNWLGNFFKDGGRVSRAEGGRTEYAPGGAVDPYQAYQSYTNLLATGTATLEELQAGYNAYLLAMQNASGSDSGSSSDGPYQITDGKKDTDAKPTTPTNGNTGTGVVSGTGGDNKGDSSLALDENGNFGPLTYDQIKNGEGQDYSSNGSESGIPYEYFLPNQGKDRPYIAPEEANIGTYSDYENVITTGTPSQSTDTGINLGGIAGGLLGVSGGPLTMWQLGRFGNEFYNGATANPTSTYDLSGLPSMYRETRGSFPELTGEPAAYLENYAPSSSGTRTSNSPGVVIDYSNINSQYGLPSGYLEATRSVESGNGTNTYNLNSKAAGDFQFIPDTAKDYGPFNAYDPYQSADAAARLAKDNMASLLTAGIDPTGENLYGAHQQGATGYSNLVKNPNALASSIVGEKAVIQNGGNANMTAGEFAKLITSKFSNAGANLGSPMVTPAAKVDTPTGLVQNAGMKPLYDPTQGSAPPAFGGVKSDDNLTTSSIKKPDSYFYGSPSKVPTGVVTVETKSPVVRSIAENVGSNTNLGTVTSPVGGGGRNEGNNQNNNNNNNNNNNDNKPDKVTSPVGGGGRNEGSNSSYNDNNSSSGRGQGMAAERNTDSGNSMRGSSASNSWGGPRKSGGFVGHYADGGMAPIIMQYGLPTDESLQNLAENYVGSGVDGPKGSITAMAAKGVLPVAMGGRIHKQDAGALSLLNIPSEPIPEDKRPENKPLIDSQWWYDNILGPKFKEGEKLSPDKAPTSDTSPTQPASSKTPPVQEYDPTSRAIGMKADRNVIIPQVETQSKEDFDTIPNIDPNVLAKKQPKRTQVVMPSTSNDSFGLSDPNRLAAFAAFARMAGTPGSFGNALAALGDTYTTKLADLSTTNADIAKKKAEARLQDAAAAKEALFYGPREIQISTYDPQGSLIVRTVPNDVEDGANFTMNPTGELDNFGKGNTPYERIVKEFSPIGAYQKGVNDNAGDTYQDFVNGDLIDYRFSAEPNRARFAEENIKAQAQGSAANQAKTDVNQMMHAITELGNTDTTSISAGGPGFKERQQFVNLFTYIGNTLGVPTDPETAANLTSGQVMRKTAAQWANKLSEGGNRPAATWMQEIASSLPDGEMTSQARAKVMAAIAVSNQMAIDYQKFALKYGKDTSQMGASLNAAFYETHPISTYQAEKNIYENVILNSADKQNLFTGFQKDLEDPTKRNEAIKRFNYIIGVKNGTGLMNMSRYFL